VPNTPTAANVSIAAEILRACDIPNGDAYFAFDSAQLTAFDRSPLDRLTTCLRTGALQGRSLRLVGHSDPRGTRDYNLTLGQSRADAVRSYLASRGVSGTQLRASSRGAFDAVGRDETGWAHDRRVDVELRP
jgi:peptidoglycan-associated lipoprotein